MDLNKSNRAMLVPPGELAGPVPRKVALGSSGDVAGITALVLVAAIFGGWFAASLTSENSQQTRWRALLSSNSREVVGQVRHILWARYAPDTVQYKFTVDGTTYYGEADEPDTIGPWNALTRSHPILIRFSPPNPTINHPAAWEWSAWQEHRDEILFMSFFVILAGIGVAYLLRERKLVREGRAAQGMVTSCTPQRRWFHLEYEFHTEEGESLAGKCDSQDSYEVGAKIWIIYLPRKPKQNHPYPLDDWIVAG